MKWKAYDPCNYYLQRNEALDLLEKMQKHYGRNHSDVDALLDRLREPGENLRDPYCPVHGREELCTCRPKQTTRQKVDEAIPEAYVGGGFERLFRLLADAIDEVKR